MVLLNHKIRAQRTAHSAQRTASDSSTHKRGSAMIGQSIFCAQTKIFRHNHIFRGLWALALSAAFLLASCDDPSSSSAKPQSAKPKINQVQAFESVGTARQALKVATDAEAEKQAAYLQARSQNGPQESIDKAKKRLGDCQAAGSRCQRPC